VEQIMKALFKLLEQLCALIRVCQLNPTGAALVMAIACLLLIPGTVIAAMYIALH
jgi:hypothetical protein